MKTDVSVYPKKQKQNDKKVEYMDFQKYTYERTHKCISGKKPMRICDAILYRTVHVAHIIQRVYVHEMKYTGL